jgi:hypothetical protein
MLTDEEAESKLPAESAMMPADTLRMIGSSAYGFNPELLLTEGSEKTNPNHGWQKTLFEIFLSRKDVALKRGWMTEEAWGALPDKPALSDYCKNSNKASCKFLNLLRTLDDYKQLPDDARAELCQEFMELQSQASVDQLSRYDDDNRGGVDCIEMNRPQGYFNFRAVYDCCFLLDGLKKDSAWKSREGVVIKWMKLVFPWAYPLVIGLAVLNQGYEPWDFDGLPWVLYIIYGVCLAYLIYLYVVWLHHLVFKNGWATWWRDISTERTYPGGVRYFSIDYWSMVCIFYMWLFFDNSHHHCWQLFVTHLVLLLFPAGPQIMVAAQCTLSSPDKSYPLGVAYIVAALLWVALWAPAQKSFINAADPDFPERPIIGANAYGPTYAGRMGLACHNPNISFMTTSIMVVGAPFLWMFTAWFFMLTDWWVLILGFLAAYVTIRHIGLAVFLMMAIAKFIANEDRLAFDHYNICTWTFWGQVNTTDWTV